jgi:hypothetical protein
MGVEVSGWRRLGCANEVVVMVRRCVHKREAGEGGEGQNCEIEPLGFDFERAIGNRGRDRWGEVARWRG